MVKRALSKKVGTPKKRRQTKAAHASLQQKKVATQAITEILPNVSVAPSSFSDTSNIQEPALVRRTRRLPSFFWGFLVGVATMSVLFFVVFLILFSVVGVSMTPVIAAPDDISPAYQEYGR